MTSSSSSTSISRRITQSMYKGKIIRELWTQSYSSGGYQGSLEDYRSGNHVVRSRKELLGSRVQEKLFVS